MNRLIGTIHWNRRDGALVAGRNEFSHSHLELAVERANVFTFDEAGYFYNPQTGVLVSIMGCVANIYDIRDRHHIDQDNDVAVVEKLYSAAVHGSKLSFLDELDGVFFVLIYDEKQERAYLAQSEFGCPLPLYYTETSRGLVFSTSLKWLLQKAGIKREFYSPSLQDFIFYDEIIPNENTLVTGVKKLVTQRNVILDIPSRRIHFESFRGMAETLSKEQAEAQLIDSIGGSIHRLVGQLKERNFTMTLTGGWDSNLMLSFLNGQRRDLINAVTINGGGATNEIPAVEHVLKFYPADAVRHITHTLPSSIFDHLPDVVWILEGYVVQTGALLRYALSGLIKDLGSRSVFLGSGADPVLNAEMGPGGNRVYEPYIDTRLGGLLSECKRTMRNVCIKNVVGDIYFSRRRETEEGWIKRKSLRAGFRQRYNTQIDYNMKMHELMLNSFGIQGLYPFINRNTVSCAQPLRPWNEAKALYKEKVKEHLGSEISSVLKKSHAVVDTEGLFETNKHWLEGMANSAFMERVLSAGQIKRIRANPAQYDKVLLKVLYLDLFAKLILSGEYDDKFGNTHLDASLEQVLK
jgi:asparagine synthetase B (glutamine-hydrolysing)